MTKVALILSSLLLSSLPFLISGHGRPAAIHPLHPRDGGRPEGLNCLSWRLAVETANVKDWKLVPMSCEGYIGNYMMGKQYKDDCEAAADAAVEYAKSAAAEYADGKGLWVFDIDETTLSNMPYYARSDVQFGALPYNGTKFDEWVAQGEAPAVPAVLHLYKTVLALGFKTAFVTGTAEKFREVRTLNLNQVGYSKWEVLILKGEADKGSSAVAYKSKKRAELEKKGYRIVGNVGDQWSDLLGTNTGNRTFKIPDPMYYIG